MAYVLGDLGLEKLGPGEHPAVDATEQWWIYGEGGPAGTTPAPANVRTCYPNSTLATLGTQPRQILRSQPCPANFSETPPARTQAGTATSDAGNVAGSGATGRTAGTAIGQRYTPTGSGKPPANASGKPPATAGAKPPGTGGGKPPGSSARPGTFTIGPQTPAVPEETIAPVGPEAPAGEEVEVPFFTQYKWWIIGGSALLVASSIGAYFLLRQPKGVAGLNSSWFTPIRKCTCGSGEVREPIYDARGIFVTYACDRCRKEKMRGYREDIFTNPNYEHDEPIESDEY